MNFFTPREVYFGWNSAENIKGLKGKIAIVSGKNVWKNAEDFLPIDGNVYQIERSGKTGEPHEEDVNKVAEFLNEIQPDWIVAVGGGSVIDSTKLAWIFYENEISWEQIYERKIPPLRKKAKFIAIETTSGTGTGISAAAVVTDRRAIKHGIVNSQLIPDISIYDPNFVLSMPKKTAIYSGMDALTHAIESYVSKIDNVASDTLALKAIELIFENLKNSVDGLEESRAQVHYGNMLAAMGFTNSRLGLCHAASHKIGGIYEIEHGKVNAILLPYFIRATEKYTRRYEDIERVLGIEDLASAIEEFNEDFNIPRNIPEIKAQMETIADEIMRDPLMKTNPGNMKKEDVLEFLRQVAGD